MDSRSETNIGAILVSSPVRYRAAEGAGGGQKQEGSVPTMKRMPPTLRMMHTCSMLLLVQGRV